MKQSCEQWLSAAGRRAGNIYGNKLQETKDFKLIPDQQERERDKEKNERENANGIEHQRWQRQWSDIGLLPTNDSKSWRLQSEQHRARGLTGDWLDYLTYLSHPLLLSMLPYHRIHAEMTFVKLFQLTIINQNGVLMEKWEVWEQWVELKEIKEAEKFRAPVQMWTLWLALMPVRRSSFSRLFFYAQMCPLAGKIASTFDVNIFMKRNGILFAQTTKVTSKLTEKTRRVECVHMEQQRHMKISTLEALSLHFEAGT